VRPRSSLIAANDNSPFRPSNEIFLLQRIDLCRLSIRSFIAPRYRSRESGRNAPSQWMMDKLSSESEREREGRLSTFKLILSATIQATCNNSAKGSRALYCLQKIITRRTIARLRNERLSIGRNNRSDTGGLVLLFSRFLASPDRIFSGVHVHE